MGYKIPWSNFHELNLDWLLEQVKKLREDVDSIIGSATPSTSIPEMDGIGSPGIEDNYARGDHRHPTDTSRAAQSDLTQEITDRGNADLALASDIADVDAKIKFSSAAPIMDSSSASAGFSDYMARADHIHPTDTSRASATDLAVLQARVDGFTGSALPSDLTPNMDGVGSAGTGGNYSRGDHVHPSDTSKLDKSGGTITGDLTIEGSLTEELRRQYITTNSIGWLRAIKAPLVYGTIIDITITRKGTIAPAEEHKITYVYNQAGPAFVDESSLGDVKYIDKIRITDAGRIDIHMDQTADSQIGVFIEVAAPTDAAERNIQMLEIEGIADAPVGETVLTVHDFSAVSKTPVKYGTANGWDYVLYSDKSIEATRTIEQTLSYYTEIAGFYGYNIANIALPFTMQDTSYFVAPMWSIGTGFSIAGGLLGVTTTTFNAIALATSGGSSEDVTLRLLLKGNIA